MVVKRARVVRRCVGEWGESGVVKSVAPFWLAVLLNAFKGVVAV